MIMSIMQMHHINGIENVRSTVWRANGYADIFRIDLSQNSLQPGTLVIMRYSTL